MKPTISPEEAFARLGAITRQLHEALIALGAGSELQTVVSEIPDARERLAYVGRMTEDAANKVLNLVDVARPECETVASQGRELADSLRRLAEAPQDYDELGQRLSTILKLGEEEAAAKRQAAEQEANQLREQASAEAQRLLTTTQEQAQAMMSAAQAEAERRVAEATSRAERLLAQAGSDYDFLERLVGPRLRTQNRSRRRDGRENDT